MPYWLQGVISFVSIMVLLRISGKRTLGQMTPEEVVIMIALGTLLVHPLKSTNILISIYGGALLIFGLIIIYFIEYYFPKSKSWIMGEPLLIVKKGEVLKANLRRSRMTEDELKMRLRIRDVEDISKIRIAILEISGDLSIELEEEYRAPRMKDIEELKASLDLICRELEIYREGKGEECKGEDNLFNQAEEVQNRDPLH